MRASRIRSCLPVRDAPVRAIVPAGAGWDREHMTRRLAGAALVLVLALAVSACGGESKEDKAQAKVCSERANIKKQVDELKSTTITSASVEGVQSNLQAISKSLQAMVKAQKDLAGDRKKAVQTATQTFTTEVANVGRQVITSLSAGDAKQQIQTAVEGLASSYTKALEPIDCSS